MEVTKEEALDALGEARDAAARTRRMLADAGTSAVLMVWGAIWIVGFLLTQFLPGVAHWAWLPLDVIGIAATFVILHRSPVRSPAGRPLFVFWLMLGVYGFLWVMLIAAASPRSVTVTEEQMTAYGVTLIMFAYVVMGLWLRSALLFWLGLGVTAVATAALFLAEPYFAVIMAFAGGGALLGSGIGMRVAWR